MFEIRYVTETDSTNDDAARVLGEPGSFGVALVTDFQRVGKGRRERRWIAPAGSALLFTAILPHAVPVNALWAVPYWTGLAVADGVERATGIRVGLQWPNDLLLDRKKCGGILCVSRVAGEEAWVGCGVGLNVVRPASSEAIEDVVPAPAFLSDHKPDVERKTLLETILETFARRLGELERPEDVGPLWEERAALAGTRYRILIDGEAEPFDTVARGLTSDGSLIVTRNGREETINLADARIIRN